MLYIIYILFISYLYHFILNGWINIFRYIRISLRNRAAFTVLVLSIFINLVNHIFCHLLFIVLKSICHSIINCLYLLSSWIKFNRLILVTCVCANLPPTNNEINLAVIFLLYLCSSLYFLVSFLNSINVGISAERTLLLLLVAWPFLFCI